MKKFFYLTTLLLAFVLYANAQVEDLTLTPGSGCSIVQESDAPDIPCRITFGSSYAQVNLIPGNIDIREYYRYKLVFGEPTPEGLQMKVSNSKGDDGSLYTKIPAGSTEFEAELELKQVEGEEEDFTCTVLALQRNSSSNIECVLLDVILYNEDDEEYHPNCTVKAWWADVTFVKLGEGGNTREYYSLSQWGMISHDFGKDVKIEPGDKHIFTFTSSQPFPKKTTHATNEELQWSLVGNGSDDVTPHKFAEPQRIYEGETEAVLELTSDLLPYYSRISIRARAAVQLPIDVKLTRTIIYANGAISREELPVIAGTWSGNAEVIDPNPGEETGENGLPCKVSLPGSWGAIKIWKETFNVAEYPMFKIVLREKPEGVQMFYRTASQGESGGIYCTWETNPERYITISEDGRTMTGEFDPDLLDGDNEIIAFCLQNTTGDAVSCIVDGVYLYNEDEEEIPTAGFSTSGIWNAGSTTPLGGTRDENGNLWDAYISLDNGAWLGTWGAQIADGTYHRYTFYTDEPLTGFKAEASKDFDWNTWQSTPVNCVVEGEGTNELSVNVYGRYDTFYLSNNSGDVVKNRVRKITRELFEGEDPIATEIGSVVITPNKASVVETQFYNAAGARIAHPDNGVTIIREKMSDGSTRTRKVLF